MVRHILPLIPPHLIYCEPFAGSAAVFFAKPTPNKNHSSDYREILNDRNGDLINLYSVCRSDSMWHNVIHSTPFSAHWRTWAKMVLQSNKKDRRSRAVAKYVAHQQGFAGSCLTGWGTCKIGGNMAEKWESKKQEICVQSARLSGVCLDCDDAIACIKRWDSPQTFFYIDPPYLGTSLDGMGQWSPSDLRSLTECLNLTQGSFITSGYDLHGCPLRGSVSSEFEAYCAASGSGKVRDRKKTAKVISPVKTNIRREVLWMRGPAAPVRRSLIPVLQRQTCFTGPLLGPCPLPLDRKAP